MRAIAREIRAERRRVLTPEEQEEKTAREWIKHRTQILGLHNTTRERHGLPIVEGEVAASFVQRPSELGAYLFRTAQHGEDGGVSQEELTRRERVAWGDHWNDWANVNPNFSGSGRGRGFGSGERGRFRRMGGGMSGGRGQ